MNPPPPPEIHDPACIHVQLYLAEVVTTLYPTYEALTN